MIEAIDEVNGNALLEYPPPAPYTAGVNNDSAVLSETAQAKLLEQQGFSIVEIADELEISTSSVISDLGVAVTESQASVLKT